MSKIYKDYFWKDGMPQGISLIEENSQNFGTGYKVVSDPYHKRISIEKYTNESFSGIIYDSALFNFRHLNPANQIAWQKTLISETPNQAICHIRNQDDRLILVEEYRFEDNFCRECYARSPQGILISIQKIFYTSFKDPFDGVILYDSNDHPVMSKKYKIDPQTQEFSQLIEEKWNMKQ